MKTMEACGMTWERGLRSGPGPVHFQGHWRERTDERDRLETRGGKRRVRGRWCLRGQGAEGFTKEDVVTEVKCGGKVNINIIT